VVFEACVHPGCSMDNWLLRRGSKPKDGTCQDSMQGIHVGYR